MKTTICAITLCLLSFGHALAGSEGELSPYEKHPLDGTQIEAAETYPNPKSNHLGLGVGVYPFNSYYTGVLLNAHFQYSFSRTFAWEVVNANLAYTFNKNLTTELADRFGVNPEVIDRMRTMISSNLVYNHSNGKFVFLKDSIRYFRSSIIMGVGLVNTSQRSTIVVNAGARLEVFTGPAFAWFFDIRDSVAANSSLTQYVSFTLGSVLSF